MLALLQVINSHTWPVATIFINTFYSILSWSGYEKYHIVFSFISCFVFLPNTNIISKSCSLFINLALHIQMCCRFDNLFTNICIIEHLCAFYTL